MYQLALLWRLCLALVNFFWRLFQRICPFHDGWLMSAPAHTTRSVQQLLTNNSMTRLPQPPYSPDFAPSNIFLFPQMKKVLKGKCVAKVEEMRQKKAETLKKHQNHQIQNLFWAVGKKSWLVYCVKWRVLWRWLKFKHVKINTQFFINKFLFGGILLARMAQ